MASAFFKRRCWFVYLTHLFMTEPSHYITMYNQRNNNLETAYLSQMWRRNKVVLKWMYQMRELGLAEYLYFGLAT